MEMLSTPCGWNPPLTKGFPSKGRYGIDFNDFFVVYTEYTDEQTFQLHVTWETWTLKSFHSKIHWEWKILNEEGILLCATKHG